MIPQDLLIQLFLSNPTEALLTTIDSEDLALRLLRDLPDSIVKCHFLWQHDPTTYTEITIIKLAIKDNYMFYKLYDSLKNSLSRIEINDILQCCAKHNREYYFYYVIGNKRLDPRTEYIILSSIADNGNTDLFKFMVERVNIGEGQWRNLLFIPEYDNIEIFRTVSNFVSNKLFIACCAAERGYESIVLEMIAEFENADELRKLAYNAAKGGLRDILLNIIDSTPLECYDEIAEKAALGGLREIVTTMINRYDHNNYNDIAYNAALYGHADIVYDMIKLGANNYVDIVECCARCGPKDLIYDMLDKIKENGTIESDTLDNIAFNAVSEKRMDLITEMIELGANDFNFIIDAAIDSSNADLVLKFIELGADDWSFMIEHAVDISDFTITKIVLEKSNFSVIDYVRNNAKDGETLAYLRLLERNNM